MYEDELKSFLPAMRSRAEDILGALNKALPLPTGSVAHTVAVLEYASARRGLLRLVEKSGIDSLVKSSWSLKEVSIRDVSTEEVLILARHRESQSSD